MVIMGLWVAVKKESFNMCGIIGSINFDRAHVDNDILHKAAETLSHRGPDSSGFWNENGCRRQV